MGASVPRSWRCRCFVLHTDVPPLADAAIHVCSNTGQESGAAGGGVAANASLVALTDGWTWHCVGCDSDSQLGPAIDHYLNNSQVRGV